MGGRKGRRFIQHARSTSRGIGMGEKAGEKRALTAHPAHNEDLLAADVRHRALGDFDEHGEDGLLQREAQVLRRNNVRVFFSGRRVSAEALVERVRLCGSEDT